MNTILFTAQFRKDNRPYRFIEGDLCRIALPFADTPEELSEKIKEKVWNISHEIHIFRAIVIDIDREPTDEERAFLMGDRDSDDLPDSYIYMYPTGLVSKERLEELGCLKQVQEFNRIDKEKHDMKLKKIKKTLDLLMWLNFFGSGSMIASSLTWGFITAVKQSDGQVVPALFILAALGIMAFAFTLYSAFKAFYIFATNQKDEYDD